MTFLPDPHPERIYKISIHRDGEMIKGPLFSVGLQIITADFNGLKIIPQKAVVFAFGDSLDDEEKMKFDLSPSMARGLAERILAMCDIAENGEVQ